MIHTVKTDWKKLLFVALVAVGTISRIFIVFKAPIWLDERITLNIAKMPVMEILSGVLDPAHIPTYNLLVKFLTNVSTGIYFLRLITVIFYLINSALIYRLGKTLLNTSFSRNLVILYSLSGYFFIFDWQIRPYTLLLTFILLFMTSVTIITLITKPKEFYIPPFKLALLCFLGLTFDYGFVVVPVSFILSFLITIAFTKRPLVNLRRAVILLWPPLLIFFIFWYLTYSRYLGAAMEAVAWNRGTGLEYFFRYVSGVHRNNLMVAVSIPVFLTGVFTLFKVKNSTIKIFSLSGLVTLLGTTGGAMLFSPLMHVRAAQFIGLIYLLVSALGLTEIYSKSRFLGSIFLAFILIGFLINVNNLFTSPGMYLIKF